MRWRGRCSRPWAAWPSCPRRSSTRSPASPAAVRRTSTSSRRRWSTRACAPAWTARRRSRWSRRPCSGPARCSWRPGRTPRRCAHASRLPTGRRWRAWANWSGGAFRTRCARRSSGPRPARASFATPWPDARAPSLPPGALRERADHDPEQGWFPRGAYPYKVRSTRISRGWCMTQAIRRRWVSLVVAAALVPVGISAVGQAQAQAPKTLVIAIGADQTGLDPQTVENNESGFIMSTIFDSIVNYKPGSSIVGPGLAQSWTISPDGRTYTFKLRPGVTFHDGTPMNAHTVAEDVDRAINPNNPCYVLGRKGVDTYDDFTFGSAKDGTVAKMDVVDDSTLRFTLPKPNAPFLRAWRWCGRASCRPPRRSSTTATRANTRSAPGRSSSSRRSATITSPWTPTPGTGADARR